MFSSIQNNYKKQIRNFIALMGSGLSIYYLFKNLDKLEFNKIVFELTNIYLWISLFSYLIYLFYRSFFWVDLASEKPESFNIYLASQIGKFIPGKIGPSYYRSHYLKDSFINQARISIKEVIFIFFAHSIISILFLQLKYYSLCFLLLYFIFNKTYKLLLISGYLNYISFLALSYYLIEDSIISIQLTSFLIISSVISLFINVVPFGLGVREGIFLFFYNFFQLNGDISELIIYSRVISISIEAILYFIFFIKLNSRYGK